MITNDLAEKIIFESKLGGGEETDHAVFWGRGRHFKWKDQSLKGRI